MKTFPLCHSTAAVSQTHGHLNNLPKSKNVCAIDLCANALNFTETVAFHTTAHYLHACIYSELETRVCEMVAWAGRLHVCTFDSDPMSPCFVCEASLQMHTPISHHMIGEVNNACQGVGCIRLQVNSQGKCKKTLRRTK